MAETVKRQKLVENITEDVVAVREKGESEYRLYVYPIDSADGYLVNIATRKNIINRLVYNDDIEPACDLLDIFIKYEKAVNERSH